jgi:hypothetical protein
VHTDADAHATVFKKADWPPAGLGVGWMAHWVPSHRSASVPAFETPTAAQAEADGHATLVRKPPPCEGLGVGWMRHFAPSHRSASVPAFEPPTAVQAEADGHATPDRPAPPCEGLGVGWMAHRVPSHRSASVPAFETPTAVQAEADGHATPLREPPPCDGLGMGWMAHRVPSHRSARGWEAPARSTLFPTAMHADDPVHEMPNRELTAAPCGLGVGWMSHLLPFHRSARVTATPEALT